MNNKALIAPESNHQAMIHLDSEQIKVLKAITGSSLGFILGCPLMMWLFGKLDSWTDALTWLGVGLIVAVIMCVFYVLGSKIPRRAYNQKIQS